MYISSLQTLEHDHTQQANENAGELDALEKHRCGAALVATTATVGAIGAAVDGAIVVIEGQTLVAESQVLRDALVEAVTTANVQALKVVGVLEEHILVLVKALESAGVVWEVVRVIRGTGVAQEDALHLIGALVGKLRVVCHDIRIARVSHEDEFALREGVEDSVQQEQPDVKSCVNVGKVERAGVEAAARVVGIDKLHVCTRYLLGRGCQIMLVDVWNSARPVGVDLGHVLPRCEVTCE